MSDYILPAADGARDHVALFVVTAGEGIRARSEEAKHAGHYFRSHALQSLAIETAEACAEWLHRRIREDWGFPDPPALTMQQRFISRYRGKRYSFGYPACPNLDDQAGIWKLLRPEEIGVQLTEGMMMDPEASVSALVFHHPDCTYFGVGDPDDKALISRGFLDASAPFAYIRFAFERCHETHKSRCFCSDYWRPRWCCARARTKNLARKPLRSSPHAQPAAQSWPARIQRNRHREIELAEERRARRRGDDRQRQPARR